MDPQSQQIHDGGGGGLTPFPTSQLSQMQPGVTVIRSEGDPRALVMSMLEVTRAQTNMLEQMLLMLSSSSSALPVASTIQSQLPPAPAEIDEKIGRFIHKEVYRVAKFYGSCFGYRGKVLKKIRDLVPTISLPQELHSKTVRLGIELGDDFAGEGKGLSVTKVYEAARRVVPRFEDNPHLLHPERELRREEQGTLATTRLYWYRTGPNADGDIVGQSPETLRRTKVDTQGLLGYLLSLVEFSHQGAVIDLSGIALLCAGSRYKNSRVPTIQYVEGTKIIHISQSLPDVEGFALKVHARKIFPAKI